MSRKNHRLSKQARRTADSIGLTKSSMPTIVQVHEKYEDKYGNIKYKTRYRQVLGLKVT